MSRETRGEFLIGPVMAHGLQTEDPTLYINLGESHIA